MLAEVRMDGLELTTVPDPPGVVVVTTCAHRAPRAGTCEFILKRPGPTPLIEAV